MSLFSLSLCPTLAFMFSYVTFLRAKALPGGRLQERGCLVSVHIQGNQGDGPSHTEYQM